MKFLLFLLRLLHTLALALVSGISSNCEQEKNLYTFQYTSRWNAVAVAAAAAAAPVASYDVKEKTNYLIIAWSAFFRQAINL